MSKLVSLDGNILELGRSCVDKEYRNGKTMHTSMAFIAQYVTHNIEIMFGCASFPGIQINNHKPALAYLYKKYLAPAHIRPVAIKDRYIAMKDNFLINNRILKNFYHPFHPL